MNFIYFLILVLSQSALFKSAHALVPLTSQTIADVPRTLPRGRFMFSYHREALSIGSEFGALGGKKPFSDQFNRMLTWNNIAEADTVRSEQLKGLLMSHGADTNAVAAQYAGSITGKIDVTVPVVGYGITDQIGIYVAVPIVEFQARSTLQYQATESAKKFTQSLAENGQQNIADEFSLTLNYGVKQRLAALGYSYEESTRRKMLGDIQIHVPYVFDPSFAIYSIMILPTGTPESPSDLFGVSSGESRFGLGFKAVKTFSEMGRFSFTGAGGMKTLFPKTQSMRVPRYSGDALSGDIDNQTHLGMAWAEQLSVDMRYQISRSFIGQAGVQHQMRFSESVSGDQYSSERYSLLEPGRQQRLESFFLNLEYNSIRAFLDGDFLFPMQLVAGMAVPISGMQTIADATGMVQVSLFF